MIIDFEGDVSSFTTRKYFPMGSEKLYISKLNKSGKLFKPSIYPQFSIMKIPEFKTYHKEIGIKPNYFSSEDFALLENFKNLNTREFLNEIIIISDSEKKRQEKIRRKLTGKVYFIDKNQKSMTLLDFLNQYTNVRARVVYNNWEDEKGLVAFLDLMSEKYFTFTINNVTVIESSQLFRYPMSTVDYIQIDPFFPVYNFGTETFSRGIIRIFSQYGGMPIRKATVNEIDFPITFEKSKRFYVPKYESFDDSIFKRFGVIDWLPKLSIDNNGLLNFVIDSKNQDSINLYLQGVTENGTYILEQKTIKINEF